jgi:II/X family phage/plasmid replication protein
LDEDGFLEVQTARRKRVVGSHEAVIQVRAPGIYELELSGNPAKFLQGHNLWGSSDPVALLWAVLQRMEASGVLGCSLASLGLLTPSLMAHCTSVSRVDCTVMLLAGTAGDVISSLRSLRLAGRLRDRGESGLPHPWDKGDGVTFGSKPGKSFRHRSITFYSKGQDVTVHPLPELMMTDAEVIDWANLCLRCEVRLGGNYLRKAGLRHLAEWTDETALAQWNVMMERMDMNGSDEQPAALADLPPRLKAAYGAWLAGMDLQSIYSRSVYYRHRADLLKAIGIDVAIPRPKEPTAQVVPIKRIIELRPAGRPPFADRIDRALSAA